MLGPGEAERSLSKEGFRKLGVDGRARLRDWRELLKDVRRLFKLKSLRTPEGRPSAVGRGGDAVYVGETGDAVW